MENTKYKVIRHFVNNYSQQSILAEFIKDDLERLGIDAKMTWASALGLTYWIYFKTAEDMLLYRWLGQYEIDNDVIRGMTEDTVKFIDEVIGESYGN